MSTKVTVMLRGEAGNASYYRAPATLVYEDAVLDCTLPFVVIRQGPWTREPGMIGLACSSTHQFNPIDVVQVHEEVTKEAATPPS